MKALILNGPGELFNLVGVPNPIANPGERIIKLVAASLNHRDLWIQKGQYANLKFPIVLGSDGCGVDTTEYEKDEVVICPSINWGSEQSHQSGQFKVIGLPYQGTFAEYISVPKENVFVKPAHLSAAEAAALPVAGLTAYRALFTRGQIRSSDTVLITGIGGGAAHMALLFARSIGAEVYVTSSSDDKIKEAVKLGAKGGAKYTDANWVSNLQEMSNGFDLVIDSAAGSDFSKLIDLTKPGGKIVFFGATQGKIGAIDPRKVFWNQISILGTTLGSLHDFRSMLEHTITYKIRPVVTTYTFEEINQALSLMERGGHFGKIVLTW